ncbi:MAG TPA: PQQ-dependent sugar dehydrogenase [Chthoniobacteraceae bacterium]|jgi:glucose/arabinose dehydrogenase/cytochrome c5
MSLLPLKLVRRLCIAVALMPLLGIAAVADEQMERGAAIYAEKCVICHQPSGQGAPPIYPPLAQSDWMLSNRERAIKVVCEGLTGTIVVNGQSYTNSMPAQMLDDVQVANVMTYVFNSWGNSGKPFTADEVRVARAKTRFKTYDALVSAAAYQPLPPAPAKWKLREVAQLPEFCTRLASDGTGKIVYALQQTGGVYALDLASAALVPVLKAEDYLDVKRGEVMAVGCTVGPDGRLWFVTNQKIEKDVPLVLNEVVIWRSVTQPDGMLGKPERWFATTYPHGEGGYNHGVSQISFGSDGMLYLSSGSRTDGGEPAGDARYYKLGEVEITACLWRMDPKADKPEIELYARGIRNAYGFAWDGSGQLFTVSNGPNMDAPEEMDAIEQGRHYGFPHQFAEWPVKAAFPYPHTPPPPAGVKFKHPVANLGPAAGGRPGGLFTFDPHSSPAGMVWCGDDFPESLRGSFVITRFGNLLETQEDVGFDVLTARMSRDASGQWQAKMENLLKPLGRPIDVHHIGKGRLLILEYTRTTNFKDRLGWLPGRIIELAPE